MTITTITITTKNFWVCAFLASLVASLFVSTALTNISAALVSIAALVYWFYYRPWYLLRTPFAFWCMVFLTWIFVRDILAGNSWVAAWGQVSDFRPLIFVILWAPLFASLIHRKVAAVMFGICMAVYCAIVLVATLWTGTPAYTQFYSRAADLSGPLLVIAIIVAAELALTLNKQRWLWIALACLGAIALFAATNRRTGYIIFVICIMALALMHSSILKKEKWRSSLFNITLAAAMSSILLLGSGSAQLGLEKLKNEINEFSETDLRQQGEINTSTGLRLRFWSVTKELIKDEPWIGTGLSYFPQKYQQQDLQMGGPGHFVSNPHNEYLYVLAGLGALGLSMYLIIQWQVLNKVRKFTNQTQRTIINLAMLAFMSSIFFNSMIIDMIPGHFYALTILCLGWYEWSDSAKSEVIP